MLFLVNIHSFYPTFSVVPVEKVIMLVGTVVWTTMVYLIVSVSLNVVAVASP